MITKSPRISSKKLRDSARGEACTMNSPKCNYNPETTVLCHQNGAGMGMKHDDILAFYGCSGCHDWFDGRDNSFDDKHLWFAKAHAATLRRFVEKGLLVVAGHKS